MKCDTGGCEQEAGYFIVSDEGKRIHLCYTCGAAFDLGQANAEKKLYYIDENPEDDDLDGLTWPKEEEDEC